MASRNRKSSPSNMAERQVVSGTASANVVGATGHALASVIFAEAEAAGAAMERVTMSRKDKLAILIGFSKENREEFKADILAKQASIADEAKAVPNRTLTDYMEDFPRAKSVYTECSMWTRMAKAVDLGWSPTNDKGEKLEQPNWPDWRLISMQASKALDAKGKTSADGKNPELAGSKQRKRGRQPVAPAQKAVNAVVTALKDDKGVKLAKNNRNLAQVIAGILDADGGATLEELTEVAAVVESRLVKARTAQEEAGKALAKAGESSKQGKPKLKDNQTMTATGATVTHTEATRKGVIPATK